MSYKVYPVTKTVDECNDYEVYVNGEKVQLNTARVSAYPFNRRWPGHERQIEQSELINFLSMQSDEEIELKIVPAVPSFSVRIRPREMQMQAKTDANGVITIRVKGDAQFTVEPYGRSKALHVFIDPISSYQINKEDENVIYYGAGEHNVGDVYLKSGQTLFLDEGAVVYATIYAFHAENVKILGRGILDNSKNVAQILFEVNAEDNDTAVSNAKRPMATNFIACKNVEIDGITIRDALTYNLDAMSCENIHINNVKVIGCWRYNSDGIHFSNCTNASLTNSFLRTYDDSICVRGFANYEYDRFLNNENEEDLSFICQDVLIKNCVIWNDWGKNLQVGTETYAKEIKNIRFEDCKLIHTTAICLGIWLVDNAKIHDVTFKNMLVEYDDYNVQLRTQNKDSDVYETEYAPDESPWLIYFDVSKHFEYSIIKREEDLGEIKGVKVDNVRLYSVQKPRFSFNGNNENSLVQNVLVSNVYWNGEPITKGFFDKQTQKNEFTKDVDFIE